MIFFNNLAALGPLRSERITILRGRTRVMADYCSNLPNPVILNLVSTDRIFLSCIFLFLSSWNVTLAASGLTISQDGQVISGRRLCNRSHWALGVWNHDPIWRSKWGFCFHNFALFSFEVVGSSSHSKHAVGLQTVNLEEPVSNTSIKACDIISKLDILIISSF